MRVGVAHHLGWAVVVVASDDHEVVDRRRIELIEPGLPVAPIHHEGGAHELHRSSEPPDDATLAALVERVRASAARATSAALDDLVASLPLPVTSLSVRGWPADFPAGIAALRRVPYESRADSVMYCQVLAAARTGAGLGRAPVRREATSRRAPPHCSAIARTRVLHGPRATLGPPWTKDHRTALPRPSRATPAEPNDAYPRRHQRVRSVR